jgi:hypothetical protein
VGFSPGRVIIDSENTKSELYKSCKDCRDFTKERNKERLENKKEIADKNGNFYCTNCHKEKSFDERAKNLDETYSILCLSCKDIERERSKNIRKIYNDSKLEFIFKFEASCQKCKCIFIKTDEEYNFQTIETYVKDNVKYLLYNSIEYTVENFLINFKDKLELRIIQLDHLTEEEQREREILSPEEIYIKKVRNVSKMSSKHAIKLESLKCQNLCIKCHLEETINREKGVKYNSRSKSEREKLEYVNQIKINNLGCSICKFWKPDLLRFFDFDHMDPKIKIDSISRIVKDNKYTIDDLIEETNKCRVLCKNCHIIHTLK